MGLSDELRRHAGPIWDRIFRHPFVTGLGDGTLPLESFKFYLVQDYRFLIDYARVLAVASAKAPDLEGMTRFAGLLHATLAEEMDLHRRYCAGFGISAAELERAEIAPGTAGYTNYLLSVAYQGTAMEIAAALLPCQWGYYEIGRKLAAEGDTSESNPYAEWIRTYASDEFKALSDWLRGYLDQLGREASAAERARLDEVFLMSSRYEYRFWEMGLSRNDGRRDRGGSEAAPGETGGRRYPRRGRGDGGQAPAGARRHPRPRRRACRRGPGVRNLRA